MSTERLKYSTGQPIRMGDVVKKSARAKSIYKVEQIYPDSPAVHLAPVYGYTSASAYGVQAIAKLHLLSRVAR